jgi:hypothetical protein
MAAPFLGPTPKVNAHHTDAERSSKSLLDSDGKTCSSVVVETL